MGKRIITIRNGIREGEIYRIIDEKISQLVGKVFVLEDGTLYSQWNSRWGGVIPEMRIGQYPKLEALMAAQEIQRRKRVYTPIIDLTGGIQ